MRRGCQWLLVSPLATGCAAGPGGNPAATPAEESARAAGPRALPAAEAHAYLASHPEALVLDVRDPEEWDDDLGHIEGAVQIPLAQLQSRVGEIAAWKRKPVVVVCRVGGRSQTAANWLAGAGYAEVMNLEGGMAGWRSSEKPAGR